MREVFDIELEVNILKENQRLALENRRRLQENRDQAIDVMGSPWNRERHCS